MDVGMIGLGIMGSAMAANLLKDGIGVIGYGGPRSNREKCDALEKIGGAGASSPREVAERVTIVVTVLPTVSSLEDVIGGENGLLASGREGLIVVEAGTFPVEDKIRARDTLKKAGMHMLDCTLSGSGAQAAAKDLVVYASGERDLYDRCVSVFNGFARSSYYLGEFGNGSKMKYIANLLVAIHKAAAAEAFALGMKSGLDPELIYEVIGDGAGSSRMFQVRGPMMIKGEYEPAHMKLDVWQKDLKIIGGFARDMGCPTPLFSAATQLYIAALAQGRDKQDTAAVCAVLEELARVKRKK